MLIQIKKVVFNNNHMFSPSNHNINNHIKDIINTWIFMVTAVKDAHMILCFWNLFWSIIRIICFIPSLYSVCGGGRLPDVKMALNNNWVCLLSLLRKSSASEKSDGPAKAHWAPYCRKHWGMASAAAAPPPPYVTSLLLAMWSILWDKRHVPPCQAGIGFSTGVI